MAGGKWLHSPSVWLLACLLYASASLLWTPDYRTGLVGLGEILLFAGVFHLARLVDFKPALAAPIIVAIVACEHYFGQYNGGFGNENFQTEFLVALIPFLVRRSVLSLVSLALVLAMLVENDSKIEFYVLWLFFIGFLVWVRQYHWAAVVFLLPISAAIYFEPKGIDESLFARVEFTFNTLLLWTENPVFGFGVGSFGYEYPRAQFAAEGYLGIPTALRPGWFAGAAHNEYAELLMGFGAAGACLLAGFIWACVVKPKPKWGPRKRVGGRELACLAILAIESSIGFPMQLPATASLAAVCLGRAAGVTKAKPVVLWLLLALGLFGMAWQYRALQAQQLFGVAWVYIRENSPTAFAYNLKAYRVFPFDWHIRYQLFLTLARMAREHDVRFGEGAFDKTYDISASANPYSWELRAARKELEGK